MSSSVELVLFYGPPFIGKTLHYFEHYSKTHSRISASEIFKEDKCSYLRLVILKVIELLKKGKNVVIDDENWYIATRQSYTSLVKKKVPNCTFTLVQFIPEISTGYEHCLWAREWVLVEQTLCENEDYNLSLLSESDEKLNCWFARNRSDLNPPESPTTSEGFAIVSVKPQLRCDTPHRFNLPALFIQWQSILTDVKAEKIEYKTIASDVINKWSEKNPFGRIIIIGPKTKNDKDIVEEPTKSLLLQLAAELVNPLYFTFIDEKRQMDQYSQLPQPGVIAFLQKLHTVHLHHKGTIYVYSSDDHYRAASSIGIRTIKAAKLFDHPHLIDSVYSRETTPTLSFLRNIVQVNCNTLCKETQGGSVGEAQIPFFSRARKSSSPLAWKYCYGKVNGICFKDRMALERYQTQYKLAAQSAQPPGETKPRSTRTEHVPSTLPHQPSNSSSDNAVSTQAWLDIDLREVAETPGRYEGGFQCRDNVFDMSVEILEQRVKIMCKCSGSSQQPYNVEAVVSDSSGLLEAHCSCPDLAGKAGRCKHVIGLLLKYKDRQTTTSSRVDPNKAGSSKNSRSSDTNTSKKRDVQTLYRMSQEELLETAKVILQKDEEKLTQEQRSIPKPEHSGGRKDVLEDLQDDRSTKSAERRGEILQEILFSAIKESEKPSKRPCPERTLSFVEDTPEDKLPCSDEEMESVSTAIIPNSLVPETISLVPETIQTVSTSSIPSCCEELDSRGRNKLESDGETFEAFLDEMI